MLANNNPPNPEKKRSGGKSQISNNMPNHKPPLEITTSAPLSVTSINEKIIKGSPTTMDTTPPFCADLLNKERTTTYNNRSIRSTSNTRNNSNSSISAGSVTARRGRRRRSSIGASLAPTIITPNTKLHTTEQLINDMENEQDHIVVNLLREIENLKLENSELRAKLKNFYLCNGATIPLDAGVVNHSNYHFYYSSPYTSPVHSRRPSSSNASINSSSFNFNGNNNTNADALNTNNQSSKIGSFSSNGCTANTSRSNSVVSNNSNFFLLDTPASSNHAHSTTSSTTSASNNLYVGYNANGGSANGMKFSNTNSANINTFYSPNPGASTLNNINGSSCLHRKRHSIACIHAKEK
ncbi:Rts3p SCDLUD_001551 [Saccharomycodes ludwigii]|uniref:Rts3p n=1 Tax=Saccharomycodes ludwigii TaxID=36035 RepID=UPI001E8786E8|nr:hypothetical protein SCDLUD_001551 [Saccharomycodes ludwigii]KAH3901773.1 hypothetical protein SCDLUD_001551 [Saccharomycodes ludwigii]